MPSAVFLHGAYDCRVGEIPPPVTKPGKVVVDVKAVGLCGSDLHYYKDGGIGAAAISAPFVPGHEFAGTLAVDVESRGMVRGQIVAVDPATPCHHCEWCAAGHHNLCPGVEFLGAPPFNGAMTRSLAVPISSLIALPAGMSAQQGAMLEPLGVCVHALDLANVPLDRSVAVVGCGPIGLGIIQLLVAWGCRAIHAVDPLAHRATFAQALGVTTAGADGSDLLDATGGRGCDVVIEATNSPDAMNAAVRVAKIGARIVLVGIPDGDAYTGLTASEWRRRGLDIRFSRRMGDVYPRAVELVRSGRIDVDALVSHQVSLDATPDAFARHAAGADGVIKTVVLPNG